MIFTVFVAPVEPTQQWRADLLEYSWRRIKQSGELIRLAPTAPGRAPGSRGRVGRTVKTFDWNPHPYTQDVYAGYQTTAGVLEWLFNEPAEGTVLLLDSSCILRHPVTAEVEPGHVRGSSWPEIPLGTDGPFGLHDDLKFLESYCVNRKLPLAPVRMPILIHTADLRKIAARWLELTALIRSHAVGVHGKYLHADRVAYTVAAAEYRILHTLDDLGTTTSDTGKDVPIVDYSTPIKSKQGEIVWDRKVYRPWEAVYTENARAGAGRDVLGILNEMVTRRESGAELAATRPQRCYGVREARILDDIHLEVPGCADLMSLNQSAAAIWELCNGENTLAEIVSELERQFDASRETLMTSVESTARDLESSGAIELEELF